MSQRAQNAAKISLVATIVVVVVKLVAAYYSGSISVLGEGLQSITDVLMGIIAVFALRYASKPPDEGHPYGHGKAELLTSAFQMLVILASGAYVISESYARFRNPEAVAWGYGALAMVYSVASNMLLQTYLRKVAVEAKSATLSAEAFHLRGDTFACAGVLLGMLATGQTGWLILDPIIAAVFVSIAMISALLNLRQIIHPLMDGALPLEEIAMLESILDTHPQVRGYHNLRARMLGSAKHVELHVLLDDSLTFIAAHEIAEKVERELCEALGGAWANIHYEPYEEEMRHQKVEHGR